MNIPLADSLLAAWVSMRSRGRPVAPIEALETRAVRRVLLALTTGLGDAVLSTPVFPALRRAFPQAEIRLLVRAAWAPLFAADPDLDGVIEYPGKYRRFFALVRELRAFSPDLAAVLHGNDPDIVPLAYLAGSRFIVRIPTAGTRYARLLSNAAREQDRATLPGVHYIDNRLRVLDTLGVARAGTVPRIGVDAARRERVREALAARTGGARYWVLHALAADAYKVWPLDRARALIERGRERHPSHHVLLTGARGERAALEPLVAGVSGAHLLAGEFDIADTAAGLASAACVVAPDTGVLHLAAAVGAPVIGLYAPTSAALVGPRASEARSAVAIQKPQTCDPCVEKRCPYTPAHCMGQIGVDEVLARLSERLAA